MSRFSESIEHFRQTKKTVHLRNWGISIGISLVMFFISLWRSEVIFSDAQLSSLDTLRFVCDAFSTVGFIYLCVTVLVLAAKAGTFNFFTYNSRILISMFIPDRSEKMKISYADYIFDKAEKRKKNRFMHILAVGLFYLLIGVILLIIHSAKT